VTVELRCEHSVVALGSGQRVRCAARGPEGEVPVDIVDSGDGRIHWELDSDSPGAPASGAPEGGAPATP
jgi:hypothetical protein